MSNVINFPIIPRAIPQSIEINEKPDPHTSLANGAKLWTVMALKACGLDWTEKVLLARLSEVRSRKMFQRTEKK